MNKRNLKIGDTLGSKILVKCIVFFFLAHLEPRLKLCENIQREPDFGSSFSSISSKRQLETFMSFSWNCHAVDSAISSGDRCDTGTAFRGWRGGEWRRWGTRRSTRRSTKALGSVLVMRVWLGEFAHFFVGRVCLEINKHNMHLYIIYM